MSSLKLVLSCPINKFKGTLSRTFDTPIILKGKWEVALTHLVYDKSFKLVVLCNVAEYAYFDEKRLRFLDIIDPDSLSNVNLMRNLTYVSVCKKEIKDINVDIMMLPELTYLTSKELTIHQNSNNSIYCVLHFRKS